MRLRSFQPSSFHYCWTDPYPRLFARLARANVYADPLSMAEPALGHIRCRAPRFQPCSWYSLRDSYSPRDRPGEHRCLSGSSGPDLGVRRQWLERTAVSASMRMSIASCHQMGSSLRHCFVIAGAPKRPARGGPTELSCSNRGHRAASGQGGAVLRESEGFMIHVKVTGSERGEYLLFCLEPRSFHAGKCRLRQMLADFAAIRFQLA